METDYKTILIAIDASEEADEVLRAATALAPNNLNRLRVITVIPPVFGSTGGIEDTALAVTWPIADFENQAAREVTAKVTERIAAYGITPEHAKFALGRPSAEIRRYAKEIDADLVVIGSHGRHGVAGLLGSTANGVLHGTPCDVLTVRVTPG